MIPTFSVEFIIAMNFVRVEIYSTWWMNYVHTAWLQNMFQENLTPPSSPLVQITDEQAPEKDYDANMQELFHSIGSSH